MEEEVQPHVHWQVFDQSSKVMHLYAIVRAEKKKKNETPQQSTTPLIILEASRSYNMIRRVCLAGWARRSWILMYSQSACWPRHRGKALTQRQGLQQTPKHPKPGTCAQAEVVRAGAPSCS